jgi:hypothetical protein
MSNVMLLLLQTGRSRHVCDRMVVGFTTICAISAYPTNVVNLNPENGEVYMYWIQHYVIKFVSDLRRVCDFLDQ